jgi:hypothetical protein
MQLPLDDGDGDGLGEGAGDGDAAGDELPGEGAGEIVGTVPEGSGADLVIAEADGDADGLPAAPAPLLPPGEPPFPVRAAGSAEFGWR